MNLETKTVMCFRRNWNQARPLQGRGRSRFRQRRKHSCCRRLQQQSPNLRQAQDLRGICGNSKRIQAEQTIWNPSGSRRKGSVHPQSSEQRASKVLLCQIIRKNLRESNQPIL